MEATELSTCKRRKLDHKGPHAQQDPASAAGGADSPAAVDALAEAAPASSSRGQHGTAAGPTCAAAQQQQQQQQQTCEAMHAAAADGVPQAPQGSAAPEQQQQQQQQQPSQRQDDPGSTLQQEHNAANPAQGPPARQPVPAPVGAYTQREEHLMRQEASGEIEFAYVLNDGQPINLIRLMGLKVIFSKQLPNMPREYICRLLLDRRHRSCALVARNGQVLGGVTYRVFPQQGLGEIAFCAVSASQQVRGFGTRLMNHTKAMARDRDHISYFLTYADNNAVGYFKKQGFTREITLPRDRWVGFIKDYDGGTLMECAIHPKLPYTDLVSMFRVQKEYLDSQIRQLSNSHVVHPGLPRQRLPMPGPSHMRVQDLPVPMQPGDVPGVKEAGWSASGKPGYKFMLRDNSVVDATPSNLHTYLEELLAALEALDDSWPFRAPVDPAEALDYYDIIHDPVDMLLIAGRLASRAYYASLEMFVADVRKMCDNCKYYNAQSTPYYQCAVKVQNYLDNYLDATVTEAAAQQQQPQQQRS